MMRSPLLGLALFGALIWIQASPLQGQARASATATQQLSLSAFGGGTGTYTNLLGGRNLGITAGADLAFMTFHRYRPVLELRGTVPIHGGQIDSQKSFLGGLAVEREFGRVHPYVDFLVGRGQITYQNGGLQVGSVIFLSSTSTVFSPGAGVNFDVSSHWSGKADFQYQSWDVPFGIVDGFPVPIPVNGTINPKVLTLAAVYRFDFNHHYRRPRHER